MCRSIRITMTGALIRQSICFRAMEPVGSSANFLEQERQFLELPGGILHNWDLMTNIENVYAAR